MYTNRVKQWATKKEVQSILFITMSVFFVANVAHAGTVGPVGGPYVPVYDETTNTNFDEYITKFDDYVTLFDESINTNPDSLRDIIASGDPQGVAIQDCKQRDNAWAALAYTNGPWASASASTTAGVLPTAIPSSGKVKINASGSTRCLLQEIVEWQKLGLSIQIHSLLKTYIADAQTKQLNNQLLNQIAAANLNWAKAGNQVINNGISSSEPVYNTNRSSSEYNVKGRQLDHILDQASADPASGNPVGSLGICEPWRLDTAANLARNSRAEVEDPSNTLDAEGTSCNLSGVIAVNDYSKFSESYNDPSSTQGGATTFLSVLNNPGNSPLGASTAADFAAAGRLQRQQESTRLEAANSGYKPTKECSGDPTDPYCLDQQNSIAITPSAQNERNVGDVAQQGNQQVQSGNTLDATAGSTTETQSTELNTNSGLLGYDETGLATSQTVVNKLAKEFYDTIQWGYFGIDSNPRLTGGATPTTEWAQATMLMIYDEMKFSDAGPEVVVTDDQNSVNTGY